MIVLAEGKRDQRFVLRYLRAAGYGSHEIRSEPVPGSSGGAGDRWVLDRYASSVSGYRKRAAKTGLIVVIDADTNKLSWRARQFEDALTHVGAQPRHSAEAIVHFIPKRNIETWILYLNGEQVDEEGDHHSRDVDDRIPAAATKFHEWTSQPPAACLPSVSAAIQEIQRL